jgi:hypothetical protein
LICLFLPPAEGADIVNDTKSQDGFSGSFYMSSEAPQDFLSAANRYLSVIGNKYRRLDGGRYFLNIFSQIA